MFNSEPSPDARRASSRDRDAKHRSRDRPKETPEERATTEGARAPQIVAAAARERGQRRGGHRRRRPALRRAAAVDARGVRPHAGGAAGRARSSTSGTRTGRRRPARLPAEPAPPARGRPREAGRLLRRRPDRRHDAVTARGRRRRRRGIYVRALLLAECVADVALRGRGRAAARAGAQAPPRRRAPLRRARLRQGARVRRRARRRRRRPRSTPPTKPSAAKASLCPSARR